VVLQSVEVQVEASSGSKPRRGFGELVEVQEGWKKSRGMFQFGGG